MKVFFTNRVYFLIMDTFHNTRYKFLYIHIHGTIDYSNGVVNTEYKLIDIVYVVIRQDSYNPLLACADYNYFFAI